MIPPMPVRLGLERLLDGPDREPDSPASASASSATPPRSTPVPARRGSPRAPATWTLTAIFGPQHGFRSDLQENMIESPHATDARRRVPVYSLYSETREPTARDARRRRRPGRRSPGCRHPHLHLHLHDGQLPARRPPARHPRRRVRSAESDRRRRDRGADARPGVCVVRRPVPDPDAPRHDDRRAGAALQRPFRARRARSTSCRWRAGRARCSSTRPACRGSCRRRTFRRSMPRSSIPGTVLFEGTLLSEGRGTTQPFELVGAPWIDGDRFADQMNQRRLPGVMFRPVVLRADVPQAREGDVRRLPDPRHRSQGVRAASSRPSSCSSSSAARRRTASPGVTRRTSTSTRSRRSTSCTDRIGCVWRSTRARAATRLRRLAARRRRVPPARASRSCCTDRPCSSAGVDQPRVFAMPGARFSCGVSGTR